MTPVPGQIDRYLLQIENRHESPIFVSNFFATSLTSSSNSAAGASWTSSRMEWLPAGKTQTLMLFEQTVAKNHREKE